MTIEQLKEYYAEKHIELSEVNYLQNVINNVGTFPFMVDATTCGYVERLLIKYFGKRLCMNDVDEDRFLRLFELYQNDISMELFVNRYKYQTLFDTMGLEYNPIENYNGTETETISESASTTENRNLTKTDTISETNTNTENNQRNTTSTSTTDTSADTGAQIVGNNSTDSNAPFESDSFHNLKRNVTEQSLGARKDIASADNSGTSEIKDSNNSEIERIANNSNTDKGTIENTSTNSHTRTLKKSGNIGVTTSQQMIEEERRIAKFNYYYDIAKSLADCISLGVYDIE